MSSEPRQIEVGHNERIGVLRYAGKFFVSRFGSDLYVHPCRRLPALIAAIVLLGAAIAALFFADAAAASWVHYIGLDNFIHHHPHWARAVRLPGNFLFVIPLAFLLWYFHPWSSQAPALLLWSSLVAGSNWILKWLIGRPRPDHLHGLAATECFPMRGGLASLFHDRGHSMPSGDTALAFAVAATFAWLVPRWGVAAYAWATLVAIERVCENAHHLSDVLAGAGMGLLSFQIGHAAAALTGAATARGLGLSPPASVSCS
jgi:membrane-associated phospholipid phosphatase